MLKKGSLNLSIQAIVIIVLAMTILGLGLGFVRGQFQQITSAANAPYGLSQRNLTNAAGGMRPRHGVKRIVSEPKFDEPGVGADSVRFNCDIRKP